MRSCLASNASTSSRLVTSAFTGVAPGSPEQVSWAFLKSRSAARTRAPSAATRRTVPRPIRIVGGGVLDVEGETMLDKMRTLEADDRLRRALLFEPRGSAPLSADV